MSTPPALVVTCEHAGNHIPARYRHLFAGSRAVAALRGHRGYDPGALALARALARRLGVTLYHGTISRLLIDLNRSPGNARLFSSFVSELRDEDRQSLIARYHRPHIRAVESAIDACLRRRRRPVVHIAVHSFTPRLHERTRNADVGILYDARRTRERALARRWRAELRALDPVLRVRRNYPYNGADDGLTRHLRRLHSTDAYLGFELEINQALLARNRVGITATVCASVMRLLDAYHALTTED